MSAMCNVRVCVLIRATCIFAHRDTQDTTYTIVLLFITRDVERYVLRRPLWDIHNL